MARTGITGADRLPCGARGSDAALSARKPGSLQVEALPHVRHYVPPAGIAEASADPLDTCVPVAARCVWFLFPQRNVKVFGTPIFRKFFFESRVERDYVH